MINGGILVVNAGSSSLKFKLFERIRGSLAPRVTGLLERIGDPANSTLSMKYAKHDEPEQRLKEQVPLDCHKTGLSRTFEMLKNLYSPTIDEDVRAVGHRIVHGGCHDASTLLTKEAVDEVQEAALLAPLHNPANLTGIRACEAFFHGRPQVGVFDTAFHHTMPPEAFMYALPYDLYERHGIRRYGMHGTSYRYLLAKAAEWLGKPADALNLIVAHLGAIRTRLRSTSTAWN